ncbi:MAG: glycine cleavage system protein T [Planctomycetota bacterium]
MFESHARRVRPELLADFAGWRLPLWFEGAVAEHRAVRRAVGVFDAAHMGMLDVRAPAEALDALCTNRLSDLKTGRSRYGFLLGEDARPIDDVIVYRRGPDRFLVVSNAANAEAVCVHLKGRIPGVSVENLRDVPGDKGLANVPVQGPATRSLLPRVLGDVSLESRLSALPRGGFFAAAFQGAEVLLSRTGYTGEPWGFEVFVPPSRIEALWDALIVAGAVPCGLAARDSLRVEAGLPLFGHEIAGPHGLDPIEAGFGKFVRTERAFLGREALLARPRARELVRFALAPASRKAKPNDRVVDARGRIVGIVTSCALAASRWIGLAFVLSGSFRPLDRAFVAAIPERDPGPPKPLQALQIGDRIALPLEAEIRTRFPDPSELAENLGPAA